MKKLLLSSIIMLGVCGIASAQTDSKLAKTGSGAAPAATPQKSAIMTADGRTATAEVTAPITAADVDAAPAAKPARIAKSDATTVNAAGEVVPATDAKRRDEKMAAVKAANEAKPVGKQVKN